MRPYVNCPPLIARATMLVVLAAAVAVVVLTTSGSSYMLRLRMANASGLRQGSQVLLGGVPVGTVSSLALNRRNVVIANLHLDRGKVHVGRGATASIVAANLLGEEYVALSAGNPHTSLPSGTTLPETATTPPTDLDQIVDVLDAPTRARLAILLREAGIAVAGRRSDVSAVLRQMPASLSAATQLLRGLVTDNHTLADLILNSDQFIGRVNRRKRALRQVIDATSEATSTLAREAGALRRTVQGAPHVVGEAQAYFADVTRGVSQLSPIAAEISQAAPPLAEILTTLKPFADAAVPTLDRAAAVAPVLQQVADQATPTIRQALPTLASLSRVAKLAQPLSAWVGLSSRDLFNVFDGWSHAVQDRDGLGHVFQGNLYLDPFIILNAADQGANRAQRQANLRDILSPGIRKAAELLHGAAGGLAALGGAAPRRPAARPAAHAATPRRVPSTGASATTGDAPDGGSSPGTGSGLGRLVGGLLGALAGNNGGRGTTRSGGAAASSGSSNNGGSSGQAPPSSLGNLLSYLLGR